MDRSITCTSPDSVGTYRCPSATTGEAFSDEPRGPHPISQFNVIFEAPEFQNIVPWLMLNREDLRVLVHPLTDSSYDDHSKNALWLGTPVPMRLEVLRPKYSGSLLPAAQRP